MSSSVPAITVSPGGSTYKLDSVLLRHDGCVSPFPSGWRELTSLSQTVTVTAIDTASGVTKNVTRSCRNCWKSINSTYRDQREAKARYDRALALHTTDPLQVPQGSVDIAKERAIGQADKSNYEVLTFWHHDCVKEDGIAEFATARSGSDDGGA